MSCKSNDSYLENWRKRFESFSVLFHETVSCQLLRSWFVTSNSCECWLLWGSTEADTNHQPLTEVTLVTHPPSSGTWRMEQRMIFLMDGWLLYHSMSVRSNMLHPALTAQDPHSAFVKNIELERIKCSEWITIMIEEEKTDGRCRKIIFSYVEKQSLNVIKCNFYTVSPKSLSSSKLCCCVSSLKDAKLCCHKRMFSDGWWPTFT